jgi:hypothetical protein
LPLPLKILPRLFWLEAESQEENQVNLSGFHYKGNAMLRRLLIAIKDVYGINGLFSLAKKRCLRSIYISLDDVHSRSYHFLRRRIKAYEPRSIT